MRARRTIMNLTAPLYFATSLVCTCTLGLAFAIHTHTNESSFGPATPADQGCDPFVLIGNPERTNLGLAWPPYLVYNSPDASGRWRMFRIGFRYDRDWRGYIFPTAAWKRVSNPLRY